MSKSLFEWVCVYFSVPSVPSSVCVFIWKSSRRDSSASSALHQSFDTVKEQQQAARTPTTPSTAEHHHGYSQVLWVRNQHELKQNPFGCQFSTNTNQTHWSGILSTDMGTALAAKSYVNCDAISGRARHLKCINTFYITCRTV